MSALQTLANPHRIKASHRRRRKIAAGRFVQRYYDAEIGRFISPDPVGPEEDFINHFNRYNYALNNPVRYTDPDGRCFNSWQSATVGAAWITTACHDLTENAQNGVNFLQDNASTGLGVISDAAAIIAVVPAFRFQATLVSEIAGAGELLLDRSNENIVSTGIGLASKKIPDVVVKNAVHAGAIMVGNKSNVQAALSSNTSESELTSSRNNQSTTRFSNGTTLTETKDTIRVTRDAPTGSRIKPTLTIAKKENE